MQTPFLKLAAVLLLFGLLGLLFFAQYKSFSLKIDDRQYLLGAFIGKKICVRPAMDTVVSVEYNHDGWVNEQVILSFRFPFKAMQDESLLFSRDDTAYLLKDFLLWKVPSGNTYRPGTRGVKLRVESLDQKEIKAHFDGVLYAPLDSHDSVKVQFRIHCVFE